MALLQPKLSLKVAQRQILTPGLMQMVSVLALNKLELKDLINTEIVENPVLEELEESVPLVDEVALREVERDRSVEEVAAKAEREKDPFDEIDFGSYFQDYLDPGFRTPNGFEETDKPSFENFLSQPSTLTDHLFWQLGSLNVAEDLRVAAEYVIGKPGRGRLPAGRGRGAVRRFAREYAGSKPLTAPIADLAGASLRHLLADACNWCRTLTRRRGDAGACANAYWCRSKPAGGSTNWRWAASVPLPMVKPPVVAWRPIPCPGAARGKIVLPSSRWPRASSISTFYCYKNATCARWQKFSPHRPKPSSLPSTAFAASIPGRASDSIVPMPA